MGPRERHYRHRSKTHAVPIFIVSFLAFLLLAGTAFGIGMLGNVQRWLEDLPDYTDRNAYLTSEPTTILDANGNKIASLFVQNRESVSNDQISPWVLKGTVDVEDERFYDHNGVDLIGIGRAVISQITGGDEGGSTITQQLVRNTILSEEQFDITIERKVREAYLALQMEKIFSKDEILNMYVNTIYYGHGAYGIQAASETYFSKNASDLTLAESALLIGLPNGPSIYDPVQYPEAAVERRNKVLGNMLNTGSITQEEYDAATAEPLTLNVTERTDNGTLAYPYFVDYVKALLQEEFSTDVLYAGGLTVKTTLDPTVQQAAEQAAVGVMNEQGANELQVGMTVIDPDTGYIKAMVGGKDYYADDAHTNHATTRRITGSSFKAITLAAAIQEGMNPSVTLNCNSPLKVTDNWSPQNYGDISYGYVSLTRATAVSANTGYVQVAQAIGNDKIIEMADKLGIDTEAAGMRPEIQALTLTGGDYGASTLEMAEAFATFAAGGKHRDSVAITEITSRDGNVLYQHSDTYEEVMSTGEAQVVTETLESVMKSGGTGVTGMPSINQPVAGKTGTAGTEHDTTDLWFCGYTPQYSVAIWTGRSGSNAPIGNYHTADLPLPIFRRFMEATLTGAEREEFPTGERPTYKPNSSWKFSGGSESLSPDSAESPASTTTTETPATSPTTPPASTTTPEPPVTSSPDTPTTPPVTPPSTTDPVPPTTETPGGGDGEVTN